MQRRQLIISFLLCLLILGIAGLVFTKFSSKKESTITNDKASKELREVEISSFPPSSISSEIDIDGRIKGYEKINLAAEVQGKLLHTGKTIKEGSYFEKGELLFKVENLDEEYNLKAMRSQLFTSIVQIMPDLKFDYPEAFNTWKLYLDAFNVEAPTKQLPEPSSSKEKYFIGGKNILNQYYTIKSAEERLKNYYVYAPFSGVFTSINNYPGSLVSPGISLGQIMNTGKYEMVSPISEKNLRLLTVGQNVQLTSDETGKTYSGSISRIGRQIDQSTQSIPVYITVSGRALRDGMYLKGSLTGGKQSGISVIPKDIIVNQNKVYVYQDSIISTKEIQVQAIKNNVAHITGLDESDQIVVSSINNLYSGQKVKI